ncbi:MAG: hypothetical protein ACI85V_002319, partial [bacterium]
MSEAIGLSGCGARDPKYKVGDHDNQWVYCDCHRHLYQGQT